MGSPTPPPYVTGTDRNFYMNILLINEFIARYELTDGLETPINER